MQLETTSPSVADLHPAERDASSSSWCCCSIFATVTTCNRRNVFESPRGRPESFCFQRDLQPLRCAGLQEPEHQLLQLGGSHHLRQEALAEGGRSKPKFPKSHRHHLPCHRQPHLPALTQREHQQPGTTVLACCLLGGSYIPRGRLLDCIPLIQQQPSVYTSRHGTAHK